MIKVSVIIPVYNAEKYLYECLESLCRQTLKEIEFILINDGSTDKSRKICEDFVGKDSRFILINQENGGSAAARRVGMMRATGEYLGFMDSDDWADSQMYEKMYSTAILQNADIVFCNCYKEYNDRTLKCKPQIREGYYNREQIISEILPRSLAGLDEKGRNHVIRWANCLRLYRNDLIMQYQIYNDPRFRRCQDLQITFEATLYAQNYFYIGNEYLYHNRVVENSQSRGYTIDFWKKLRILIERLYQDVEDFKEADLRSQMDLCAFFFAVQACSNEGKHLDQVSHEEIDRNLEEIYTDVLCSRFLQGIPYEKLSNVNKMYFDGLKKHDKRILLKAIRKENTETKQNWMKAKILSIYPLRVIYMKLKDCFRKG